MSRAEMIFPAAIFVFVAVMVAAGHFVFQFTWTAFVFPLGTGLAVCALCAVELIRLRGGAETTAPAGDAPPPLSIPGLAWMAALAVFLFGLGFVAGPAAYLLACLRANGFSWGLAAGVAAASVAVTWGLFIKVMHVLLPITPLWMS
jgi:hypothetical protein